MSRLTLFKLLFILFLFSCSDEESQFNTDESIQVYFERFENEALIRNIQVDLSVITSDIIDIGEDNIAGQCFFQSHAPNHITIDREFWDNATTLLREMVVFHELGHCYLGRSHRDSQNAQGFCSSIMRSGLSGCVDNYTSQTRTTYIDELFEL